MAKRDESAFSDQKHHIERAFRSSQPPNSGENENQHATNHFKATLEGIRKRELLGRWLHALLPNPEEAVQSLFDHAFRGGRWSPPRSFPVMYTTEEDAASRAELNRWLRMEDGSRFIVVCIKVQLGRVLDLCSPVNRAAFGTTTEELNDPVDLGVSRAIGVAAYKANYQAILYPRPLRPDHRNLAIFPERVGETDLAFADPTA
jgi:hypothetical protein